jgi:hypothetical protein
MRMLFSLKEILHFVQDNTERILVKNKKAPVKGASYIY